MWSYLLILIENCQKGSEAFPELKNIMNLYEYSQRDTQNPYH